VPGLAGPVLAARLCRKEPHPSDSRRRHSSSAYAGRRRFRKQGERDRRKARRQLIR
jgi:hypothetical protein